MSPSLPALVEPANFELPPGPAVVLIQVTDARVYAAAHLPGALLVEPRALLAGQPPVPGKLPDLARLEELFAGLGHRPDTHYLVYDDEGGGWAGRFAWTLDVIGHRRWSYLDGGLHAWHALGRPLEAGAPPAPARTTVSLTIDRRPIAETDDLLAAIGDPDQLVWDVRSAEEYRGEKSGSRRAGHVPGAVNLDWMHLKDPDRQLRLVQDLPALLERRGIDPSKRILTHCQSHHRSGLSYLIGRLLGFREIRGYHGSWAEWGSRDDTPVATGPAPGAVPEHAPR